MIQQVMSTSEVAAFADVTLRQLQWWDERKIIRPRHEGHARTYTGEQAAAARIVGELRRKGISLARIRQALRAIKGTPAGRFLCMVRSEHGTKINLLDPEELVEQLELAKGGVYVVEIVQPDFDRAVRERERRAAAEGFASGW